MARAGLIWHTTNKAAYSTQIAESNVDNDIFGIKSANKQEVYIGWYPWGVSQEILSSIYLDKVQIEVIPRTKTASDSTSGLRLEWISQPYSANVSWANRPSATSQWTTNYDNIVADKGINTINLLTQNVLAVVKSQMHLRVSPIYSDTANMVVTLGRVNDATSWAQPYYTVYYQYDERAIGAAGSSGDDAKKCPYLIVCDPDRTILYSDDDFTRWYMTAWRSNDTGTILSTLKWEYSTDAGSTWKTLHTENFASYGWNGLANYGFLQGAWPTQYNGTALIKITLTDAAGYTCSWQKAYTVTARRPRIEWHYPNYDYVDIDNDVLASWNILHTSANAVKSQIGYAPYNGKDLWDDSGTQWQYLPESTDTMGTTISPSQWGITAFGRLRLSVALTDSAGYTGIARTEIVARRKPFLTIAPKISVLNAPWLSVAMSSRYASGVIVKIDGAQMADITVSPMGTYGKYWYNVEPLSDGKHTLTLEAYNELYAGKTIVTQEINISNAPNGAIALTADAVGHMARLSWTATGTYTQYMIYRDGAKIATTTDTQYDDIYAPPSRHEYVVRGKQPDRHYALSNVATVTPSISGAVIAATDTGSALEWLSLRLGTDVERAVSRSVVQDVTYTHYAGRDLPVAELSEYRDESYSGTVVLTDPADRARFEALLGHEVCFKRRGISVMGMMAEISSRHTRARYDAEYSFTIRAIDAEVR